MNILLFASAAVTIAVLGASPALAQSQPQQDTSLDSIIITAEKSDRSLQDTQTSVAVTTAAGLEEENIQSLQEIYSRTANVSETFGHDGFSIRGIANQGVTGGGAAPLTTVYIDGAPLPTTALFSGATDAWDIRQVEILRGPQSTLQGLNALAGAVVVRSEDPSFAWSAKARLLVADPSETSIAFAGGGPLIKDQLAFRVAVEKRDGDGFIFNTTRNTNESPLNSLNLRGKLRWTPANLPQFEARLGYIHFQDKGAYRFSSTRTDTPNFYDNRVSTADSPNDSQVNTDIGNLELTYGLSDRLKLSSVTSYSTVDQVLRYDGDGGPAHDTYGAINYDYDTLTQELRLNYKGPRVSGLLGAFYYDRDQFTNATSRTNVPTPTSTISLLLQGNGLDAPTANGIAGLYAAALPRVPVDYVSNSPNHVETYALFGDGQWQVDNKLSLIGGFRWDHENNTITVNQQTTFAGTYPNPGNYGAPGSPFYNAIAGINLGVGALVAQANAATPATSRSFDAFLPKLGVNYAWTDDVATAFVVQRGYRSGGSSANTARSIVVAYDPEYTWNYEASLRTRWLDGGLIVNANAYYVDWTDQQVAVNFGLNVYDYQTVNAGRSHLYGFEVETLRRVNAAFDWYGSIGYSRTKFDQFIASVVGTTSDLSGSEFAFAPAWTFAIGGNYRWAGGWIANLNADYHSSSFTDTGPLQASSQVSGRTLVNTRLGYETERWGVYAYAKNLFDVDYMTFNRAPTNEAILGDGRVVGMTLQARW